ncbi:Random slug protein 5 [Diplonema papillatum]|nr:Random slug protein 5 [Diplonema papillatum]|eukprot:gene18684-28844_t
MASPKLVDTKSVVQLTKEERAAFNELRSITNGWTKLSEGQKAWIDDECLLRYLRARKFKVKKAKEMLIASMNWRVSHRPHLVTGCSVRHISAHMSNYINGRDKHGRPVVYMRFARDPPNCSPDEKLKFLTFTLEEAIRHTKLPEVEGHGVEKMVYIIDLDGFSLNAPGADMGVARKWIDMLQNHYPERLHRAILVRYPSIFSFFWSLLSPFIDKQTTEKVVFAPNGDDAKLRPFFEKHNFDATNLEKGYGGNVSPPTSPRFVEDSGDTTPTTTSDA